MYHCSNSRLYSRVFLWLFLNLALSIVHATSYAQTGPTVFNEYTSQPDVWRPVQALEPGVNANGDLNLSIPVLTIPGRNGLDFTVRFDYRSGIKVKQQSSWIGLGWSFDPGSITRDVQGVIYQDSAYNVDYNAVPAAQPDMYYVTSPGGGFTMLRSNLAGMALLPPNRGQALNGFYASVWQPWKIAYTTGVVVTDTVYATGQVPRVYETEIFTGSAPQGIPKDDYTGFTLIDPNGTRYLFENPTLATYQGMSTETATRTKEFYVDAWRLTAILGPDYPNDSAYVDTDMGSWITFSYTDPETVASTGEADTPPRMIKQATYLTRIDTPTHWAEFDLAVKPEETSDNPWTTNPSQSILRNLTEIRLYSKADGTLVKRVELDQDFSHTGLGTERMKLKEIQFFGKNNASLPGYRFEYEPDAIATSNADLDDLGFYDGPSGDPYSWSLTEIIHPGGGRDVIGYARDQIEPEGFPVPDPDVPYYVYYSNGSGGGTGTYGAAGNAGGGRVSSIRRYDGMGTERFTFFDYGTGRLSGVPTGHWDGTYGNDFFKPNSRGKADIYYESIERHNPDNTRVKTFYTTDLIGGVDPVQTLLYEQDGAFTVIEGNQHINWGRVWSTEVWSGMAGYENATRRTLFELDGGLSSMAKAFVGTTNVPDVDVVWRFGNGLIEEVVQEKTTGGIWVDLLKKQYEYDSDGPNSTRQLIKVTEIRNSGADQREHKITYAHEVYPGINQANQLTLKAQETLARTALEWVIDESLAVTRYLASAATTFKQHLFIIDEDDVGDVWHPQRMYQWMQEDSDTTEPVFSAWDEAQSPPAVWNLQSTQPTYDVYGHVLQHIDALDRETDFYYGSDADCSNNGSLFQFSYLTCVSRGSLFQKMDYYADGMLKSLTEANGSITTYTYDEFLRLQDTFQNGEHIAHYAYTLQELNAQDLLPEPHRVVTAQYTGTLPAEIESRVFFDGLGQSLQVQTRLEDSYLVTATEYDVLGRVHKAWKPYSFPTGGAYDAAFGNHAGDEYSAFGTGVTPYIETGYTLDGFTRPAQIIPEHVTSTPVVHYDYGLEAIDGFYYHFTQSTDEDGRVSKTITDGFGHTRRQVSGVGSGVEATTRFVYDVLDRLVEVTAPNQLVTTYRYDTAGRLIEKTTSDVVGSFEYRYDAGGNLRFVKDPNRTGGGLLYTIYDDFDRVVESGLYTGSTTFESAPADTETWPQVNRSEVIRYTYDAYSGLQPGPATGTVERTYPKGRLTQVEFDYGYYQYFYDLQGRVTAFYVALADLEPKLIEYEYDRLGTITQVRYQSGKEDAFYHWYVYDEAGRLEEVYTHTAPDVQNAVREARYSYTATGQVAQLLLGETDTATPVQTVDYAYHIRDWLLDINDIETLASDTVPYADRFAMRLGYDDPGEAPTTGTPQYNGNVAWIGWYTAGKESVGPLTSGGPDQTGQVLGYTFNYDALNRLTAADFSYKPLVTGNWISSSNYDVGTAGDPIQYDPSGNILRLVRRKPPFPGITSTQALDYTYTPGTNRLATLADGATSHGFTYDANGNMTTGRNGMELYYAHTNLPDSIITYPATGDANHSHYRYDGAGRRIYKRTDIEPAGGGTPTIGTNQYYVRGLDGTVLALYNKPVGSPTELMYFNIIAGARPIGRVEVPAIP